MNDFLDQIVKIENLNFDVYASQQFATVLFDRNEDSNDVTITVVKDKIVNQFKGNNKFNPSLRRHSSCVYIQEEENPNNIIKVCTIQHKGIISVETKKVREEEYTYLFANETLESSY